MIHSLDLKLKNWVKYNNGYFQIAALTEDFPYLNNDEFGHGIVSYDNIFGIELTEDILVKCCGFEKPTDDNFGGYLSPKFQNGRIRILNNKWWNGCWDTEITYLHELQNLIHSLTKKELVIDLTKL